MVTLVTSITGEISVYSGMRVNVKPSYTSRKWKRECGLVRVQKSSTSFSGFSDPHPVAPSSSATNEPMFYSSSPSRSTSSLKVPPGLLFTAGELESQLGFSGEGLDEAILRTTAIEQDSVLVLMWRSLAFTRFLIKEALVCHVAGPMTFTTNTVSVSVHAAPVYVLPLPCVSSLSYECWFLSQPVFELYYYSDWWLVWCEFSSGIGWESSCLPLMQSVLSSQPSVLLSSSAPGAGMLLIPSAFAVPSCNSGKTVHFPIDLLSMTFG